MERILRNWYFRRLLLLLGMIVYFAVAFTVMEKTGIGCVFLYFLGIPCPGCGMTRALAAVLRGDAASAFSFHPLWWTLPLLLLPPLPTPRQRAS